MLNLSKVHPALKERADRILATMQAAGFPMFIVQGTRTAEEQHALWLKGRDASGKRVGKTVTNCDGYKVPSNHQLKPDGFGYALDLAFVDDPQTAKVETWDEQQPWDLYGTLAEALGLRWGGRWKGLLDRPHIELPYPFEAGK